MTNFKGFDPPAENWSKLPHQLINEMHRMTESELKVVLYTLRHTWGFGEFEAWEAKSISTDEYINGRRKQDGSRIDNGTGLSKPSVYSGLAKAMEHGYMVRYVDNTDLGRVTHYYRLRSPDDTEPETFATDPGRSGSSPWHNIDPQIKERVYRRFEGRCAYCEKKSRKWHYDHIVPVSQGGPDDYDNLALSCPQCNMSKKDRTPEQWGRPVVLYENDVKIFYQGWKRFLTTPGKDFLPAAGQEFLHRTEKETIERNQGKEAPAAEAPNTYTPAQEHTLKRAAMTALNAELPAKERVPFVDPIAAYVGMTKLIEVDDTALMNVHRSAIKIHGMGATVQDLRDWWHTWKLDYRSKNATLSQFEKFVSEQLEKSAPPPTLLQPQTRTVARGGYVWS